MNKRISEIAEQAGIRFKKLYIPDTIYVHESPAEVTKESLQKFAELLIRECVEVCKSRVGNSDYNTGRMHCVSDIKEYFGVK